MPQTFSPDAISTERLDLLPLEVGYAAEMAKVLSDPALHGFTGGEPDTEQALAARYARMIEGSSDPTVSWLNWVIHLREEGALAGTVQATVTPGPVAEVAWVVGTPWQRRGIAREAVVGLVEWLRDRSMQSVIAHVHPDHAASAAVAVAAGLTPTGEQLDGENRWRRTFTP